ncbi:hypothetical protein PybrP1_012291 [[Pythium] brassicae (nom. inval.)]|nr:hypothetical protein PybrP1_012291 [[Pythium] brassicae (nom. inval.)]
MDVTCGIVLKSAMQKHILQESRQTLLMDWTHETNSLGSHLGSSVPTVPSARGVRVLDFIGLDE